MEERSVAVEVGVDEDEQATAELEKKLQALRQAVAERGGIPLGAAESSRYGARFCVSAADPAAAVDAGVRVFKEAAASAGLPDGPIVDAEANTLDELAEERAQADVPALIDVMGLADLLGVSYDLATILIRFRDFPPPVAELSGGPVWTCESIDRFLRRAEFAPPRASDGDLPERARKALSPDEE
ncbi:MAG: hypothetical protein KY454_02735 [Actinobacteria bacterium]|nr:hypothetical protein [Actinomycetota bacterium]